MTKGVRSESQDAVHPTEENLSARTFLKPWQEIVGNLERVSFNGPFLEVHLTTKSGQVRLSLEKNSPEIERLHEALLHCPIGSPVGFLKTDSRNRPVMLHKFED